MTDPDIRALADQLEAHAASYVHAHATERLLRQAAAALTALMAERDEARSQIRLLGNAAVRVTLERDGMRRAAFARAKEIAEGWETEAAGTEYKTCGNGIFWDPGTNYDQGRIDAAAAIEAEMRSDEIQHSVQPLTQLEPEVKHDPDPDPLEDKV